MFTPLSFLFSCSSLPSGSRSIVSSALLNILPSCLYAHIFLWTCVAAEIKDRHMLFAMLRIRDHYL